ncbi:hypothetical protein P1J78_20390 [Psychromarinibacter sp. C21-152]|uniref:Uncharacterized protein n=1 Tax=Psychromarinibacter sediminicola TaxID=3033385 RepID=A0AAE3TAC0_9RHOB|nr:hypothetical protein [Psychromarinibacter sediminicola]MDF0603112.1 hypothetical protein [Psychromarinibacter sediminicola]
MAKEALIWFVVTVLPGGEFEARPYEFERSCRVVAEAFQRINEQVDNGKQSYCRRMTERQLDALAMPEAMLR